LQKRKSFGFNLLKLNLLLELSWWERNNN